MKHICGTCKHWTEKRRMVDGREIKGLRFCPVLGARGTYTTRKCYCQYWEPVKFKLIRIGEIDETETR